MTPNYIPILSAKKGEFDALSHISPHEKKLILPVFELPKFLESQRSKKKYQNTNIPITKFIREKLESINDVYGASTVMLDIFKWAPNSVLENGEHVLVYACNYLTSIGTPVIPVIGYDRWEDLEYAKALETVGESCSRFCIRLESYAFDDMLDEEHFIDQIENIIDEFSLEPSQCSILIDLNDVSKTPIPDLQDKIDTTIKLLRGYGFDYFSIAGCSITQDVNDMVPDRDSSEKVLRREMIAWQSVKRNQPATKVIFGDYGVSNPNIPDELVAPDANGKIRYTIKDKYLIARGHSRRQGNKGAQMHDLAMMIVTSGHFMKASFSWGDLKIEECSRKVICGNPTNWVSYDLSHHMKVLLAEVYEFERNLSVSRVTT